MNGILRDGRRPGFHIIDNELIDNYGAKIGVYGVAVYTLLARYAGSGDSSFPSYQTIADKLGMSRRKAVLTVQVLIDAGLIERAERKTHEGFASNLYTLVDLKGAQDAPGSAQDAPGSAQDAPSLGHEVHPKKKQLEKDKPTKTQGQRGGGSRSSDILSAEPQQSHPPTPPAPKVLQGSGTNGKPPVVVNSPYLSGAPFNQEGYIPAHQGANPVQVYYERFSIRNDRARLTAPLEDDLARQCPDLDRLRDVVTAYSQHLNYVPGNIKLVVEWYHRGIPDRNPANGRNNNQTDGYANGRRSNVERSMDAVDRIFARLEAEGVLSDEP